MSSRKKKLFSGILYKKKKPKVLQPEFRGRAHFFLLIKPTVQWARRYINEKKKGRTEENGCNLEMKRKVLILGDGEKKKFPFPTYLL